MQKKKIHYHSDCQFFAGCENMLVNFFTSKELMNNFRITFSYRDTPDYRKGLYSRIKPKILCYPLKLPYLSDLKFIQKLQKNLAGRLIVKIIRIFTNIPILIYEIRLLKKLFLSIKPDIVHINSGGYPPTLSSKSAVIEARLSVVKTVILVVNNLAEKYNSLSRVLDYPMDKVIAKNVDFFVTASAAAKDRLKSVLSLDNNKVLNIYNGIKLRNRKESLSETRVRLNLNDTNIRVFGMVSLLIPRKGHKVLIRAIDKIFKKKISNFIVLIEGYGVLKEDLEKEIKERGLEKFCKFVGVENNIFDFIAALDCLILPSIDKEDFPNVVLEAMALGKIVIASKFSGIIEQITHEKTGFLFNKGNHESLADLMIDFIQNNMNFLNEMGLESKKFMSNFTDYIYSKIH